MARTKTQKMQYWFIDPDTNQLHRVKQVSNVTPPDQQNDELPATDFDSTSKEFEQGLSDPGQAEFEVNYDLTDDVHYRLDQIKESGDNFKFAVGYSDGTSAPTVDSNGEFVFPADRSFRWFTGFIKGRTEQAAPNELLRVTYTIRVSGSVTFVNKNFSG